VALPSAPAGCSKLDTIVVIGYSGRQCLSVAIVADRVQPLTAAPMNP
jgi:hypothetical protein